MELHIHLTSDETVRILDTSEYRTNQEGELDILANNGYVIATFAAHQWTYVRRVKDPATKWPDPEPEEETKPTPLDLEIPMFDYPKTS